MNSQPIYNTLSKNVLAIMYAVLFFVVAMPMTYKLTDYLARKLSIVGLSVDGCPKLLGVAIHALVFGLLARLLMML